MGLGLFTPLRMFCAELGNFLDVPDPVDTAGNLPTPSAGS